MQGDPEIIELLNEALSGELTAINQYFGHAKLQAHWGYGKIAAHSREESIEEMSHAETVIDRVLFLEGHPNLQRVGSVRIGQTVPEQFRADLDLEHAALDLYRRAIERCREAGDHGTRELFEKLLTDEERHVDWLETQLGLIEALGEANYLAQQLHA